MTIRPGWFSIYYPCCRERYWMPLIGSLDDIERVVDSHHDAERPTCSGANIIVEERPA